jgi:hypothetical protein
VLLHRVLPWPQPQALYAAGEDNHHGVEQTLCLWAGDEGSTRLYSPDLIAMTGWFIRRAGSRTAILLSRMRQVHDPNHAWGKGPNMES